MFGAIARWFRAIFSLFTGKIDESRKSISQNPSVVRATYDRIIREKKSRIQQYKDAIASMIAQEEKKKGQLKTLTEEVEKLSKLKEGAAAMARRLVEKHDGDAEAVKGDPEYLRCQSAYRDFSSTLEEKEARCNELESDINEIQDTVGRHKTQLESIMRELEDIKTEKHETVADMITAREEKEIADMINGISDDRTSEELSEMRELRREAKAGARVAREATGMDAKHAEQEFLKFANDHVADDEFDALIGLSKEDEAASEEPSSTKTQIPES